MPTRGQQRDHGDHGGWWDLHNPVVRLRLALGATGALLSVGTLGYWLIEPGFTLFDGFYMTLITVSTVGFTEVGELSTTGRLFTSALIMGGMVLVAFGVGSFVETLIEGGLARYFGRLRLARRIEAMKDHWIICGYGRIGVLVAKELEHARRDVPFVVIEKHPERARACEEQGIPYVMGDATHDETLQDAGIERAAGIVSLVATDAENVFICLTARELTKDRPDFKIIARALEENSEPKLRRAGAHEVVAPYHLGGLRLGHAILRPTVQDFLDFAMGPGLDVELEEVRLEPGCGLVGVALKNSPIRFELDLIVLAVHRKGEAGMIFNPRSDTVLQAGDVLVAMGTRENLDALEQRCAGR